jgi:hypothetical protein
VAGECYNGAVNNSNLSQLGKTLVDSLRRIEAYETETLARREKTTVHIPTVGSTISTAYEQLRNASEYAEDELLQQRAIRRYLKRELSFHVKVPTARLADELVTELTQSEYLPNDFVTKSDIAAIKHHIKHYYDAYWQYADTQPNIAKRNDFATWTLDVLAVRCEQVLGSHIRQLMFAHFAFLYLREKVTLKKLRRHHERIDEADFAIVLYAAIHRSLLKSDNVTVRTALIDSYQQDITDIAKFESFNTKLDYLLETKTVAYATRIVGRNGAALRFIYTGFFSNDAPLSTQALRTPDTLEHGLRSHIEQEYVALNKRLDKGILRSIVFLLITKSIVGFAIEVPYDLLITGAIIWVPLLINLFFPSIFIAFSRLTLTTPNNRNTKALISQITDILYGNDEENAYAIRIPKESSSIGFNTAYTIMFLVVFAGLSYVLYLLEFNIVQGVIFFIFLSTAAFLSFRLSRQIHELEVVHAQQGSLSLIRDIMYMPFIYVGQQISYRYSQVNIVALILDILIELPLKTILRLVRQWMSFLNAKKDELL